MCVRISLYSSRHKNRLEHTVSIASLNHSQIRYMAHILINGMYLRCSMPPFSSHRCRAIEWLPVFKPNTDTYNKQFTCYTRLYRNIERTNTIAIELANSNLSRTSLSLERTGLSIRFRTDEKSHSCCYSVTNMNFVSRLLPSSTRSIDFKDFSRKQRSN